MLDLVGTMRVFPNKAEVQIVYAALIVTLPASLLHPFRLFVMLFSWQLSSNVGNPDLHVLRCKRGSIIRN
jgi:hypothetical protein